MKMYNNVCIYMRLSKEDGDKIESESITNQRNLLNRYAEDIGIQIKKEYIDDGYSGTNFNRPAFKEMLEDIKNKRINTIIVKDLSRFARESINASEYIEKIFPKYNIRFIAVLDNVDTYLEKLANELIEFKLYNNQKFAKDVSEKMKKSKRANMEKGLYMGTFPPYGYVKDPDNKGKLLIDKKSSKIVKKIYDMYLSGKSSVYIAKYLTSKNIKTPAEYYNNIVQYKNHNTYNVWKHTQVNRILKNQVYIGNVVRNVVNKRTYKAKGKRHTNKEEWIITENMHEPIIDKETFYEVQEIIKSKKGSNRKLKYNYQLRPYLYCAKCGRKVVFNTRSEKQVDIACPKSNIKCCDRFYYNYYKLEKIILDNIREYYNKLFDFSEAEDRILLKRKEQNIISIEDRIKKLTYTYNRLNDNLDCMYLEKLDDKITQEEYLKNTEELKKKREQIQKELKECKTIKENFNNEDIIELKNILSNKNNEMKNNITRELIDKLIYKIEVSKNEIKVHYKFKFF